MSSSLPMLFSKLCSDLTRLVVPRPGLTQAPKYAPRLGGVGATPALTVLWMVGLASPPPEPHPAVSPSCATSANAAAAARRRPITMAVLRPRPADRSDAAAAGVQGTQHALTRDEPRRHGERERHPRFLPVRAHRPAGPAQ